MRTCTLKEPSGTTRTTSVRTEHMATRLAARWVTMAEKPTMYITGRTGTSYHWALELASNALGLPIAQIEHMFHAGTDSRRRVLSALDAVHCTPAFGRFSRSSLEAELDAYRYIYDADPWCIVLDRLSVNNKTRQSIVRQVETIAPCYMLIQ